MTEPKLPLRRQKKLDDEKMEARWTTAHPFLPFLVHEGHMSDYSLGQAITVSRDHMLQQVCWVMEPNAP